MIDATDGAGPLIAPRDIGGYMNPQGPRQPGGGEHRPQPGGYPAGNPAPFDQQETQQAQVFPRPPQPPAYPQAPQGYPPPPQYAPPPAPPSAPPVSTAPQPSPEPPRNGWMKQLQQRQWWIAGGVVVIAGALVAYVMGTGDKSGNEDTATASTTVAQVPAGPTTTVPSEPSAEATPTPTGSPAPPPPPPAPTGPTLTPDALAPLLLPAAEIDKQLNITGASSVGVDSQPLAGNVEPPHCTGAWGPAYAATYSGTGFTGAAIGVVVLGREHRVGQAALAFPDPAAAKRIYDKLVADWNACQNTHAVFNYQGAVTEVDIKTPRAIGDIDTLMLVPTTSPIPGQQCERGMALRGNVIVDVRACSPTVGSAGYSITRAIADKVR